jgi:hypothetical protein
MEDKGQSITPASMLKNNGSPKPTFSTKKFNQSHTRTFQHTGNFQESARHKKNKKSKEPTPTSKEGHIQNYVQALSKLKALNDREFEIKV